MLPGFSSGTLCQMCIELVGSVLCSERFFFFFFFFLSALVFSSKQKLRFHDLI